ncbi:porin [Vibrio breoganii]|uniref:porin n=1 Tax=Vibrio breoganii TaxID=553239 RepID=UPI0010BDB106|nr:porin [Vibrio breoganii]TKG18253.1 porin [Vibrio breoganii]
MSLFKKSLVAVALSSLSLSGAALADGANSGEAVQKYLTKSDFAYEVYGIIALQAAYRDYDSSNLKYHTKDDDATGGMQLNNESRIGFRGKKQFKNLEPTFLWQIEGAYVDPSFSGPGEKGLGYRDTFVGFESDGMGQVRLGRVLTPIYELVDWPGSNPGLGDVYDWGGAIGGAKYQDRQSNTIRWDTPKYFDALSFDLAVGAGDDSALGQGDSYFYGAAGHYNVGPFQFDLAYERNEKVQAEDAEWTNNSYLVGIQAWFENGISLFAQYKYMDATADRNSGTSVDENQSSMTSGLMYTTGDWQYKLAYAANFDLERDGQTIDDTSDDVISAQIMYFVDPSAVIYLRARFNDFNDGVLGIDGNERWTSGFNGDFDEYSVGVEYYF